MDRSTLSTSVLQVLVLCWISREYVIPVQPYVLSIYLETTELQVRWLDPSSRIRQKLEFLDMQANNQMTGGYVWI